VDAELQRTVRGLLAEGRGAELIVELIDRGRWNSEEVQAIRDAMIRAAVRNVAGRPAWIRSSSAPMKSTTVHLWRWTGVAQIGEGILLQTPCALKAQVPANRLVVQHELSWRSESRNCETCRRRGRNTVTLGDLYESVGARLPGGLA
jgi:hypothetical protein